MNVKLQHTALPTDISAAIRQFKQQIRQQIGDVEGLFRQVCQRTEQAISDAKAEERLSGSAWPVISPDEIAQGLTPETRESIKRRGCVVVKQHFPREQALAWDASMLRYLDENQFDAQYRGPGDNFFGSLEASRPEIYPIYWSQAQMEARQSHEMARVQSCLNRLWTFESGGQQWFDPDVNLIYRIAFVGDRQERPRKGWAHTLTPARWNAGCCPLTNVFFDRFLTAILSITTHGMPHIAARWMSLMFLIPRNARLSERFRDGRRCPI